MSILELLKINKKAEPPFEYDFIYNLPEKDYPEYLKKLFRYKTKEELPLKREKGRTVIDKSRCRTFNQKIQWLKLYGITDLMRDCTDKAKARDYAGEKIGAEYLKPVLQIIGRDKLYINSHGRSDLEKTALDSYGSIEPQNDYAFSSPVECLFDMIDFDSLPDKFVMKCTHGCKWHAIVKDKNKFLADKQLYYNIRQKMTGWLEQEFWAFEGFEMQYKGLEPKIIIESYMPAERYIEIYCFNGVPKIYSDIQLGAEGKICTYNEDFSYSDLVLKEEDKRLMRRFSADDTLKLAGEFSKQLTKGFKFVRADWIVF